MIGKLRPASGVLWCLGLFLWASIAAPAVAGQVGVGLQVVPTATGELVVLATIPGSAAEKGGLKPGDLLVEVDGTILAGTVFTEVVRDHLWGEAGTSLQIVYKRPGEAGIKRVKLLRTTLAGEAEALPGVRMLTPDGEGGGKVP